MHAQHFRGYGSTGTMNNALGNSEIPRIFTPHLYITDEVPRNECSSVRRGFLEF